MATKRRDESKTVRRYVSDTYFDVKMVFKHQGEGRKRKVTSTSYGVYHSKRHLKSGFKTADEAELFAIGIFPSYNKKTHKFSEPSVV